MQPLFILTALALVASISAEHVQEVSNAQTVPASVQVDQPSHVVGHTSAVESGPQQVTGGSHHHQHHQQQFAAGPVTGFEHMQPMAPHYYSPAAGMIQAVGQQQGQAGSGASGEQQGGSYKPTGTFQTVRHYAAAAGPAGPASAEQYGQPESASVPPGYKPFGSWGLYIGGNPADGYYTNYYKALSNSVTDKQQVGGEPATAVAPASAASAGAVRSGASQFAVPTMKQGPFFPSGASYQDQTYQGYPYGEYYTPADLNSGSRVTVQSMPSTYSSGSFSSSSSGSGFGSAGSSPMMSPAGFVAEGEPGAGATMYYAADYASKKSGQSAAFSQKEVQVPSSPVKGYHQAQQRAYYAAHAYQAPPQQASAAGSFMAASPVAVYQQQQQQQQQQYQQGAAPAAQVVAYPVPVGSQMVGSQPGVDGAFQPYGVHAFTRYAVKPTVVGAEQTTYYHTGVHSSPASHFPAYKQQQYYGYPQPLGFYGYPLSQLHYSNGAVAPSFGQVGAAPAGASQQPAQPQQQASFSTGVQHPAQDQPQAVPMQGAPAPGPAPAQGATVVVEHAAPVGPVRGPVAPMEAASSEKSETSQVKKDQVVPEQKSMVAQQHQHQHQKSN